MSCQNKLKIRYVKCDVCTKEFETRTALAQHKFSKHLGRFECLFCEVPHSFNSVAQVQGHMNALMRKEMEEKA